MNLFNFSVIGILNCRDLPQKSRRSAVFSAMSLSKNSSRWKFRDRIESCYFAPFAEMNFYFPRIELSVDLMMSDFITYSRIILFCESYLQYIHDFIPSFIMHRRNMTNLTNSYLIAAPSNSKNEHSFGESSTTSGAIFLDRPVTSSTLTFSSDESQDFRKALSNQEIKFLHGFFSISIS